MIERNLSFSEDISSLYKIRYFNIGDAFIFFSGVRHNLDCHLYGICNQLREIPSSGQVYEGTLKKDYLRGDGYLKELEAPSVGSLMIKRS